MQKLPPEIAQNYLADLDPTSLVSFCRADKNNAAICDDSYFWRQKARAMLPERRRELQEDWFLFFAKGGHTRLLRNLCDAIDDVDWVIDEWAVALALVYLAEKKLTFSPIVHYLEEKFAAGREGEELEELLARYFGPQASNDRSARQERYVNEVKIYSNRAIIEWQEGRTDLPMMRPISRVDALSAYEAEQFEITRHRNGMLLPSMNAYVLWFTWKNRSDETEYNKRKLLRALSILLNEAVEERQVHEIVSLIDDVRVFDNRIADIDGDSGLGLNYEIDQSLIRYGDLELVNTVFEAVGQTLADLDIDVPFLCGDLDLYKESMAIMVTPERLAWGIGCMEPQEWLKYVDSLPLDEEQHQKAIKVARETALHEGYSYFAREIAKELN